MIYYFLPTRALIWNANKDHLLVKIFFMDFKRKEKDLAPIGIKNLDLIHYSTIIHLSSINIRPLSL